MEEQKNKRGKVGLAAFLLADVLLIGAAAYMIVMRQQDIPAGYPSAVRLRRQRRLGRLRLRLLPRSRRNRFHWN